MVALRVPQITGHRDTETLEHQDTGTPRHRDTSRCPYDSQGERRLPGTTSLTEITPGLGRRKTWILRYQASSDVYMMSTGTSKTLSRPMSHRSYIRYFEV